MRHVGTQEIETPRLLLRRRMPSDAPMMYSNWANDPEVTRWLRWTPHKDVAETQELLSAWALLYPNEDYYQWAIVEKATGQVFGSISLYNSLPGEPQQKTEWPGLDLTDGVWEPGYCIGRAWWGKGCTTEALNALVEYWFKNRDSYWLACSDAVENRASGKVMMKAGFVYDHDKKAWDAVAGVNITLGLPIIRVSVDHGTAFDQAGTGTASELSLRNSIEYAVMFAENRK